MAGRKPDPNKKRFEYVGFRPTEREWLQQWAPSPDEAENLSRCLDELLERAMTFWPLGPNAGLPVGGRRAARRSPAHIKEVAAKLELSPGDAVRELAARYLREHPELLK